ncbi:MAG: hypothetical protein JST50_12830 [Bacteroidetes bacterium]|jgi:hypothetical protein|nr:hypothetical protein [Bacteroidota bacterium]
MKTKLILVFSCLIWACHSPKRPQSSIKKEQSVHKIGSVNKEYLDRDSVKLNDDISMMSSFKATIIKLGKPDSIITPDSGNISQSYKKGEFKYCHFKGVLFEKYQDSLVFRSIDLPKSPGWFLSYKRSKFSSNTTIDSFKKLFPNSVEDNELHGTSMDENQWIRIAASPDVSDTAWVFLFDRNSGKLKSIEYWIDD